MEENREFLQSCTFDLAGMLAEVAGDIEGDSSVLATYTYDGLGNRTKKVVEQGGRTVEDIRYLANPESAYGDIIWSQDSITGETCVYTYGKEVIRVETEGETRYYRSDEKKSVTEILDEKGKSLTGESKKGESEAGEKHGKFKGEPGQIKTDGKNQIKIGDDGRATKVTHNSNHGNPKYHTNPHDHNITWTPDGNPSFGDPINYPNAVLPFN